MEETAKNVDRLVTVQARWGGRADRGIIPQLYECACKKLDGKPPSLVAAQGMVERLRTGDRVLLVTGFAYFPDQPYGETDGPLGVASLARAVSFGFGALPVLVTGPKDIEGVRHTVNAAGLNIMKYSEAKETFAASEVIFPCLDKDESKRFAANIMDEYTPKAVISVETVGPNKKGAKHFASGGDAEAKEKLPALEYLFYEASARGVLTIGVIDQGNELGSGLIEEDVRRIVPYADVCCCSCGAGIACNVKADVVFPAAISNWGAYGISAMLGCLLKKPEILQDAETEQRMLEACIMAGVVDGLWFRPIMQVDGVSHEANEALITILHAIIKNALLGLKVDQFVK